jgi:hypothetical protein
MTRRAFVPRIVEEPAKPSLDAIREQSAREGKHLSDAMRLTIQARNWAAVHVAADRRAPVVLPETRRGWRG